MAPGSPPAVTGKRPEPTKRDAAPEPKDSTRELVETIVFVVVLVLLLKTFLAEAFVIPTGSMADTLLGYHREFKCEQCGFRFLVDARDEAEKGQPPRGGYCPCGFFNAIPEPEREIVGLLSKVDDSGRILIQYEDGRTLGLEVDDMSRIRINGRDGQLADL